MMSFATTVALLTTVGLILPILLPNVTELPWGLEDVLSVFMANINMIITTMPWMAVIWHVLVIGLTIKTALLVFDIFYKVVKLIRGGG